MRISNVSGMIYRQAILRRDAVVQKARVSRLWHDTVLVRVDTDEGLIGWGEAFGHFGVAATSLIALETIVAPRCIGADPMDESEFQTKLERPLHAVTGSGPVAYALAGLDIALWDLRGKALGRPVHALLGGARVESLPAYASLMRYAHADAVAAECTEALGRGYVALKVHEVGLEEIRAAAAIAASRSSALMVDVNCPWSLRDATAFARKLEPLAIHWLEEPIWPPENYRALAALRARTRIALAAGENALSIGDCERMLDLHAVDHAQPSVTKIGGISAMRRIAAKAASCNIALAPHSPYFGPGLLATIQVCAALAPQAWIEHLFYELQDGPFADAVKPSNGRFKISNLPGLGADPDPDLLDRCRIAPGKSNNPSH